MMLRCMSRSQWLLQNTTPSCPPVIIPDLHKLTLRLSLTRVRRELWHLLLFVNRSRWKHRCGKAASHDAYRSACLVLAAPIDESRKNNWALFQERQHGPFRVWVYQPLPVNPQQGELYNPLSVHCGQPLYLGGGICGRAPPWYRYGTPAWIAADWYPPSGDEC